MRRFVAIIGSRNAGKSTVIKSLTGCPNNSFRDFVEDQHTGHSIFVSCGSPQENSIGLRTLPELQSVLQRVIARDGCRGVVMAIQPSFPYAKLTMEGILAEAQRLKFKVSAYVLDPEHGPKPGTLSHVVQRLTQLRIVPLPLDGRRFAHLNASHINAATSIVA